VLNYFHKTDLSLNTITLEWLYIASYAVTHSTACWTFVTFASNNFEKSKSQCHYIGKLKFEISASVLI